MLKVSPPPQLSIGLGERKYLVGTGWLEWNHEWVKLYRCTLYGEEVQKTMANPVGDQRAYLYDNMLLRKASVWNLFGHTYLLWFSEAY